MAENENRNTETIEWIEKEPIPRFRYRGREFVMLNDSIEVEIGGVAYHVKSIYSGNVSMGDVLDALIMEKITRAA